MGGEDWYRTDDAAVSADGSHAYITREYQLTITLIDTKTNAVSGQIPIPGPFGIAMTGDGRQAFVASLYSNNVYLIDTSTNAATPLGSGGCSGQMAVAIPLNRSNVNQYLSLQSTSGKLQNPPCAPGGTYLVTASWKNASTTESLTNFFTQVATLTGGNQLIGYSFSPTLAAPGQTIGATFQIKLAACVGFNFMINVLGVPFP